MHPLLGGFPQEIRKLAYKRMFVKTKNLINKVKFCLKNHF